MKKIGFVLFVILGLALNLPAHGQSKLTSEEKLYNLSLLWSQAKYSFAFFEQVPQLNWDSCYRSFIPKVMKTESDWEYYLLLQQFYAQLNDGHTRVLPPVGLRNQYFGSAIGEIRTKRMEGKVIITEVVDDALNQFGIKKGMEIVSINHQPVEEYAGQYVAPYVVASTPQDKERQIYDTFLLSGSPETPVMVEAVDANNRTIKFPVNRRPWIIEQEVFKLPALEYSELPGKIGLLKINNFMGDDFTSIFDSIYVSIRNTKGLIVDVRKNWGGNSGWANYVLQHLALAPFQTNNWQTPRHIAAFSAWGNKQDWYKQAGDTVFPVDESKRYLNPVVVLADETTFSAGEDFCAGFVTMKRGKLIGSPTAGSTGQPVYFQLLGGGAAMVCTKKDVLPDGREFVGYGIQPDMVVKPTIEDIRDGNDRVLKRGLSEL